jgi:hypothetical protein
MSRSLLAAGTLAWVALAACASEPAPEARLLVKLVQPATDGDAIARQAAAIAGTSVAYAAAVSPQWHALRLRCASARDCAEAQQRLREQVSVYEVVQTDVRRRAASSP